MGVKQNLVKSLVVRDSVVDERPLQKGRQRCGSERITSTLGYRTFAQQVEIMNSLGFRSYINRAFDTLDPKADIDDVMDDISRELGFDLADFAELREQIAQRAAFHAQSKEAFVKATNGDVSAEGSNEVTPSGDAPTPVGPGPAGTSPVAPKGAKS